MRKDAALDQVRKARRKISRKYGNDTRSLLAHYRALEPKFAARMVRESAGEYFAGEQHLSGRT